MKSKKLTRKFFERKTLAVAKELLGKFLVRNINGKKTAAMITETEAYCGPRDLACHASRGRTKRTEVMFGPAGHAYIYLIYGMYYCLNVVTGKAGYPAAVLIRAVEFLDDGLPKSKLNGPALTPERAEVSKKLCGEAATARLVSGPGKVCRHFQIDKSLCGEDLAKSNKLWIEDRGVKIRPNRIKRTPRIGVDYAGSYRNKLWRFLAKL